MVLENKSPSVSQLSYRKLRKVNNSYLKKCSANIGVKSSKASRSDAVLPKNYLAWYVPLRRKPLQQDFSQWKCPPKFNLNVDWQIAAGEESQEVEVQRLRESTVAEVRYPHLSDIPPSPFDSLDVGCELKNDNEIPHIPIIPTEVEAAESVQSDHWLISSNLSIPQNQHGEDDSVLGMLNGMQGGDLVVAAAIVAAAMQIGESFDTKQIFDLIGNPDIVKSLIVEVGKQDREMSGTLSPSTSFGSNAEPIPNTSFSLPSSEPDSAADKFTRILGEGHTESTTMCMPKPLSPLLSPKPYELARKDCDNGPKSPIHLVINEIADRDETPLIPATTTTCEEQSISTHNKCESPSLVSDKTMTALSSTSKSNVELFKKRINENGVHHISGIKPYAPLMRATPRPNVEKMKKRTSECFRVMPAAPLIHPPGRTGMGNMNEMINGYKPLPLSGTPMANRYVFNDAMRQTFSSQGMYHSSAFSQVTTPPVKDSNYYKSLIRQHGQIHENEKMPLYFGRPANYSQGPEVSNVLYPNFQRPSEHFNTLSYFQNGHDFSYLHNNTLNQPRGSRMTEASHVKRMRFCTLANNC